MTPLDRFYNEHDVIRGTSRLNCLEKLEDQLGHIGLTIGTTRRWWERIEEEYTGLTDNDGHLVGVVRISWTVYGDDVELHICPLYL